MSFVALKVFYVYAYLFMHVCRHAYFYNVAIRKLKTPAHLKTRVRVRSSNRSYSFRIGTLVMVYKRAVIEIQSHVRLVVAKAVTLEGLAPRKASGQKKCRGAP